MKRAMIVAVLGFVVLTQYVNCSSYSDSTMYGKGLTSTTVTPTSYQSVRVLNGDTYMNCEEDHVQLGGACNEGEALDNYIEYRITKDRATMYWGTGPSMTSVLNLAKCENGHFYAVVPKPNDSSLATTGSDYIEYQVTFQIYTSTDRLQYKSGEKSRAFSVQIQKNGGCG